MGISSKKGDCERGAAHARLRTHSTHIIRTHAAHVHTAHTRTRTLPCTVITHSKHANAQTHVCMGIGCVLAFFAMYTRFDIRLTRASRREGLSQSSANRKLHPSRLSLVQFSSVDKRKLSACTLLIVLL